MRIINATSSLNFTTLTSAGSIEVLDSSELLNLNFPVLRTSASLAMSHVGLLQTLSLPRWSSDESQDITTMTVGESAGQGVYRVVHLNITSLPQNLLRQIYIPSVIHIGNLFLTDMDDFALNNVTSISNMQTDFCPTLPILAAVDTLKISALWSCAPSLTHLTEVGNVVLKNIVRGFFTAPELTVSGSLVLEDCIDDLYLGRALDMGTLGKVGSDLNITSNFNVDLDIGGLTSVSGSLSLSNNTNCTFNFNQLTVAGDLFLLDNTNTTLPLFPALERVRDIHLRGNIDT